MTPLALSLVLLSACSHSIWNFLLKGSTNREVFTWWMLISVSILLIPLGVILFLQEPFTTIGLLFILGTVILHILYYILLARGYTKADLSLVYPIARGMAPILVPILGIFVLNERVSSIGLIGILIIILGIGIVYWWGRIKEIIREPLKFLREPGLRYAVGTGIIIAIYSIWDKVGVSHINPVMYMYSMTLGTAISMFPIILRLHGMPSIQAEWNLNKVRILGAGAFDFLSYVLILTALTFSPISYIAPAREIGIVLVVLLGSLLLKEPFGKGRILGSLMIVLGVALVALAN